MRLPDEDKPADSARDHAKNNGKPRASDDEGYAEYMREHGGAEVIGMPADADGLPAHTD